MVDFLFAVIKHFRQLFQLRRYKQILVEVGVLQTGVGHFKRKFQGNGISSTNLCWYQKTRVITLSCDIKISAVCFFVSLQSTRVIDKDTDGQTNGQNCDPQDRAVQRYLYLTLIRETAIAVGLILPFNTLQILRIN